MPKTVSMNQPFACGVEGAKPQKEISEGVVSQATKVSSISSAIGFTFHSSQLAGSLSGRSVTPPSQEEDDLDAMLDDALDEFDAMQAASSSAALPSPTDAELDRIFEEAYAEYQAQSSGKKEESSQDIGSSLSQAAMQAQQMVTLGKERTGRETEEARDEAFVRKLGRAQERMEDNSSREKVSLENETLLNEKTRSQKEFVERENALPK